MKLTSIIELLHLIAEGKGIEPSSFYAWHRFQIYFATNDATF